MNQKENTLFSFFRYLVGCTNPVRSQLRPTNIMILWEIAKTTYFRGTVGPLFALVCPCFRINNIVACKIVLFLFCFDNFHLKMYFLFILKNKFQNGQFNKRLLLTSFFTLLVTTEKAEKNIEQRSYLHEYTYLAHWCWFLFAPFWSNPWIIKWWAKFKLGCLPQTRCIYFYSKWVIICKNEEFELCKVKIR